jgi:hypothetical protein
MIVEINFFSVFFDLESEYGIGLSLTITIFALEGVAIIFSNPLLTFNLGVIKVRYEVYSSSYQHSSILRE